MKQTLVCLLLAITFSITADAQKYYTKNGTVSFFSTSPLEDIKAANSQVMSVLNIATGELQFSMLIKGFHFPKALMEEHFNENYLESDKYPKSTFKGKVANLAEINFTKDGTYTAKVDGDLMIHNVTNKISTTGTITVKDGKISSNAKFIIALADYKIKIPEIVKNNIAKTIEITVACNYPNKM